MSNNGRLVTPIIAFFGLIAIIATVVFAQNIEPRLGLDLRGGTSVTFDAIPASGEGEATDDEVAVTIDILRGRIDSLGVSEAEVYDEGGDIVVAIPDVRDPDQVIRTVGTTAELRFRPVLEVLGPDEEGYDKEKFGAVNCAEPRAANDKPDEEVVLCGREPGESDVAENAPKYRLGAAALRGLDVEGAQAIIDPQDAAGNAWSTQLQFSGEGARKFAELTGTLAEKDLGSAERSIGVTLDGVVINSPPVAEDVQAGVGITGGTAVISGQTEEEARALAPLIEAGALPLTLEPISRDTVSATLGDDSLRAGLLAGAIGLVLVFLYLLVFYRLLGLVVWLGLAATAAFNLGLLLLLGQYGGYIPGIGSGEGGSGGGFTLTLAGIAGLIVAVGISADSYIIMFERLKDEVREGRTLRTAGERAWVASWKTLLAANVVSLAAAVILYWLAVGPVRGFAFTLGIATLVNVLAAWLFIRPTVLLLSKSRWLQSGSALGARRAEEGERRRLVDFLGRTRLWLGISAAIVLVSSVLLFAPGLKIGIDFRGGAVFDATTTQELSEADVRDAVGPAARVIQITDDEPTRVRVQTETLPEDQVTEVRAKLAEVTGAEQVETRAIGAKWGSTVTRQALIALAVFLVAVALYVAVRFEPKMAAVAVVALLHDLLLTAGIYAVTRFEVTPATVVALLTIMGYSLYDTVVVFDKVRENTSALSPSSRVTYSDLSNQAINQTAIRSINTSLTSLLPVGSLLFVGSFLFGAETLQDLSLALFVGMAVGTYSSIFLATPLLALWKEREPANQRIRARAEQLARRGGADAAPERPPARAGARPGTGMGRPRPGSRSPGGPGRRPGTQAEEMPLPPVPPDPADGILPDDHPLAGEPPVRSRRRDDEIVGAAEGDAGEFGEDFLPSGLEPDAPEQEAAPRPAPRARAPRANQARQQRRQNPRARRRRR